MPVVHITSTFVPGAVCAIMKAMDYLHEAEIEAATLEEAESAEDEDEAEEAEAEAEDSTSDGDGKGDILWQHDSGQVAVWLMDGNSLRGGGNGAAGRESGGTHR